MATPRKTTTKPAPPILLTPDEFAPLCSAGDTASMRAAIADNPYLANEELASGITPLMLACKAPDALETLLCLLEFGANPRYISKTSRTAIMSAIVHRRLDALIFLLPRSDPGATDLSGRNLLIQAATSGWDAGLEILIASKLFDLNATDRYGRSPLMQACVESEIQCARLLLRAKAKDDLVDFRGSSCYALARDQGGSAYTTLIEAMALEAIAIKPTGQPAAAPMRL